MNDHHRFSDQALWAFFQRNPHHPVYKAYSHQLVRARVVSGLTLVLGATSIGLFGLNQVGGASALLSSSFGLSISYSTWLLCKRPSLLPAQARTPRPSLAQGRVIALCFGLGVSTLIGLTILTMVYRDQVVRAMRQGQVELVIPATN